MSDCSNTSLVAGMAAAGPLEKSESEVGEAGIEEGDRPEVAAGVMRVEVDGDGAKEVLPKTLNLTFERF